MLQRIIRSVALAVAVFAASSCFLLPREEEILEPPLVEPPQIKYQTMTVQKGTIEDAFTVVGTFVSNKYYDLHFQYRGGRLRDVYFTVGDEVAKGDVVAELFTYDLEDQIKQQQLKLRRAQIAREEILDGSAGEYQLTNAELDVELARIRLEDLKRSLEEAKLVASVRGAGQQDVERLESDIQKQEIALRKAELSYERLKNTAEKNTKLELANLDIQAAELELARLRREMGQARLRAPASGIVVYRDRSLVEGEYVNAFQNFMRIADPRVLLLRYEGTKASDFSLGQDVQVELSNRDYRDQVFTGRVILTAANVPFEEREDYRDTVLLEVDDLPDEIEFGDRGSARVSLAKKEDVIVVPRRSVYRYATRRYVQLLQDGIRVERDVETGLETSTEVEIVGGLEVGEELILR
jgi:multidrug efflux pump subunit AcrA (membrane-fusion protein)